MTSKCFDHFHRIVISDGLYVDFMLTRTTDCWVLEEAWHPEKPEQMMPDEQRRYRVALQAAEHVAQLTDLVCSDDGWSEVKRTVS